MAHPSKTERCPNRRRVSLQLLNRERGMINDHCENETRLYQQHLHLLMAWPKINLHSCSSQGTVMFSKGNCIFNEGFTYWKKKILRCPPTYIIKLMSCTLNEMHPSGLKIKQKIVQQRYKVRLNVCVVLCFRFFALFWFSIITVNTINEMILVLFVKKITSHFILKW